MVQGSCDVIHLTSSILLLSCLISSDFLAPPWARKFFLVGARISSLKLTLQVWCKANAEASLLGLCWAAAHTRRCISNAAAKVRRGHCGSRILPQEKSIFFQEWSLVSCVTSVIKRFALELAHVRPFKQAWWLSLNRNFKQFGVQSPHNNI